MKFDELDNKMRVYEQSLDQIIAPENYIVARIDGRSFTRLTKEVCRFEAPFDKSFGRKVRKLNTILSGTASASFSLQLGQMAVFDCRIIPLPDEELVGDYFAWRMEDCTRNCLNSWCYWTLRKEGEDAARASDILKGKSTAFKSGFLSRRGIDFNGLPAWQKRGVGVYWKEFEKTEFNPVKGEETKAIRRELFADYDLPKRENPLKLVSRGILYEEQK